MKNEQRSLCIICAWRKNCLKKFNMPVDLSFSCPDFTKDIRIKVIKSEERKSE